MSKNKIYYVYFRQVNQTRYEVEANGRTSAISKAEKEWKKENGPSLMSVECIEGDFR